MKKIVVLFSLAFFYYGYGADVSVNTLSPDDEKTLNRIADGYETVEKLQPILRKIPNKDTRFLKITAVSDKNEKLFDLLEKSRKTDGPCCNVETLAKVVRGGWACIAVLGGALSFVEPVFITSLLPGVYGTWEAHENVQKLYNIKKTRAHLDKIIADYYSRQQQESSVQS